MTNTLTAYFSNGRLGEYYRFHTPPDISSSKSIASTADKEIEKPLENGSELQEGKEWKDSTSRCCVKRYLVW